MDPSGCNMESRLKLGTRLEADLRWAVIAVILHAGAVRAGRA